jgi:thioredoxin 1
MKKSALILIFCILSIRAQAIEITDVEHLELVLKQPNKLMLFDMYADWCKPCKMLEPILKEVGDENKNVQVYKVDIEKHRAIAQAFNVRSIPLVLFFKNGRFLDQLMGLYPKEYYVKAIEILDK